MSTLRRLPPDERELSIAARLILAPCPFCGGNPIAFVEANDETGLFVGRVACTVCHGGMHYCGRTRREAREGAVSSWARRDNGLNRARRPLMRDVGITPTAVDAVREAAVARYGVTEFTCDSCGMRRLCVLAFDPSNTGGACLAETERVNPG